MKRALILMALLACDKPSPPPPPDTDIAFVATTASAAVSPTATAATAAATVEQPNDAGKVYIKPGPCPPGDHGHVIVNGVEPVNTRIVFSPSRRRPGCVLLQAVFGGDIDSETFDRLFPAETWLTAPTDDMAPYPVDDARLEILSQMANAASDVEKRCP